MNPAVEMLIERMKSHPEDFFGPVGINKSQIYENPRLYHFERMMDRDFVYRKGHEAVPEPDDSAEFWFLDADDRAALRAAFTEAKRERFTADVIHSVMAPAEDEKTLRYSTVGRGYGKSIANSTMVEAMRLDSSSNLGIGVAANTSHTWNGNK